MEFEPRPYGPDFTEEERAALLERVRPYEDGIVYYSEIPCLSLHTAEVMFDHVKELAAGFERWGLLVNLSESMRPTAEQRDILRNCIAALLPQLAIVAVYTTGIVIHKTTAKFVLPRLGLDVVTFNREEDAAEAIREALRSDG